MAITKVLRIYKRLDKAMSYSVSEKKTVEKEVDNETGQIINYAKHISTLNCSPENAYQKAKEAMKLNDKSIKVLGYRIIQSFKENEVDAKTAHEIGVKLAEKLLGEKFNVVIGTHLDTAHIHNDISFGCTSFVNGSRFDNSKTVQKQIRDISDELCREYKLSVVKSNQISYNKSYAETIAKRNGKATIRDYIRKDIDIAISKSYTINQFWEELKSMKYKVNLSNKYYKISPEGSDGYFRLYKLGENYTFEKINERISQNKELPVIKKTAEKVSKIYHTNKSYKKCKKAKGLMAMYLHYRYLLLGAKKTQYSSSKRTHFLLHKDLIKMNAIIAQQNYLIKHKINTLTEVQTKKNEVVEKITVLQKKRAELKNKIRRVGEKENVTDDKLNIVEISNELKTLYNEKKLCDNIKIRSININKNINIINKSNLKERKDEVNDVRRNRRSEPSS